MPTTYNVTLEKKRFYNTTPRKYKFWTDSTGGPITTVWVVEASGTSTVDLITATATRYLPARGSGTPGQYDDFEDLVESAAQASSMTFAITTDSSNVITSFTWNPSLAPHVSTLNPIVLESHAKVVQLDEYVRTALSQLGEQMHDVRAQLAVLTRSGKVESYTPHPKLVPDVTHG